MLENPTLRCSCRTCLSVCVTDSLLSLPLRSDSAVGCVRVCVSVRPCEGVCGVGEAAAVFCIRFLSPYILPSFLLSFLPPTPHSLCSIISPPSQATTGCWEMMSADLQRSLSAAASLAREYCKNKTRQTSSRGGNHEKVKGKMQKTG